MLLIPQSQSGDAGTTTKETSKASTDGSSSATAHSSAAKKAAKLSKEDAEKHLLGQMKKMRYHVHAGVVLKTLVWLRILSVITFYDIDLFSEVVFFYALIFIFYKILLSLSLVADSGLGVGISMASVVRGLQMSQ